MRLLPAILVLWAVSTAGLTAEQTTTGSAERSKKEDEADARKLETLVKRTGLKFEKRKDGSWSVSFRGDAKDVIVVNVKNYEGLALVQSVVAENPSLSTETLTSLLTQSFNVDLAKAAIDDSGDLVAMQEAILRTLDADGLKEIVNAVAAFTDDLAEALPDSTGAPVSTLPDLIRSTESRYTALEGLQGHVVVRYDPFAWRQTKTDEPGISQFQHTNGDLYLRFIHERIAIPMDKLADIAFSNAKTSDASAKVTRSGERLINGVRVLFQEWQASINGVPLAFYGHFFSDASGSVQMIGWTGPGLIEEKRSTIERFVAEFEVRSK